MSQKKSKFPIVQVIWEDFCVNHNGWHDAEDIITAQENGFMVKSVGYLVSWDKNRIILTSGCSLKNQESGYQEIMQIPRGMIKKITYLGATNVPEKALRIVRTGNRRKR